MLTERNENVGKNQMMKKTSVNKTDAKFLANDSFAFNKSEPHTNLWRGSFPFT